MAHSSARRSSTCGLVKKEDHYHVRHFGILHSAFHDLKREKADLSVQLFVDHQLGTFEGDPGEVHRCACGSTVRRETTDVMPTQGSEVLFHLCREHVLFGDDVAREARSEKPASCGTVDNLLRSNAKP